MAVIPTAEVSQFSLKVTENKVLLRRYYKLGAPKE